MAAAGPTLPEDLSIDAQRALTWSRHGAGLDLEADEQEVSALKPRVVLSCVAAAALGMTLAACGSQVSYANDPRNPDVGGIATVSPSRSISFYADQYVRIRGTCTADQERLGELIAQKPLPTAEISTQTASTRSACQTADIVQFKAAWPASVYPTILNQANADSVVKQPFTNEAAIEAYVATAKAHADAVRTTLDLPTQR